MTAANRRRGADAERSVVNYLRDNGYPDARRYLAGDGRQPGDIDFHPLVCLEVKDVAKSAWPTWCRQAFRESPEGTVPAVVRRTRGVADVGEWTCRYWWGGWRNLGLPAVGGDMRWLVFHHDLPGGLSWHEVPFAAFVAAVRAVDSDDALNDELVRFATGRDA